MRRGEIWWAELEAPDKKRPVLLLSRDDAYIVRALIIIAPVTTRSRGIPAEVCLTDKDGMPQDCVVNLDTITTVPKDCLRTRLIELGPRKMKEVEAAVHFALGMET